MQTIHCSKVYSFLVAAVVLSAGLGFAAPVFAYTAAILNPDGKLTYLSPLGGITVQPVASTMPDRWSEFLLSPILITPSSQVPMAWG
jgi:hypothetical protein